MLRRKCSSCWRSAGSSCRSAERSREESDQLPEEGPAEQVHDDEGGESRDEAERTPGVPGEGERGTGQAQDEQDHGAQ